MRFLYLIVLFVFSAQVSAQGVVWGGAAPTTKISKPSANTSSQEVSKKLIDILQAQKKQSSTSISQVLESAASRQNGVSRITRNTGRASDANVSSESITALSKLVSNTTSDDDYSAFLYIAGTCNYFDDKPCVFDFLMSAYEVTNQEYARYDSEFYSTLVDEQEFNLPVTNVSVRTAIDYAIWLSATTGRSFRLPTLQEWKLAAESVNRSRSSCLYANYANQGNDELYSKVTVECGVGYDTGAPVGSLEPSYNGIYDLYGNASEWVCVKDTIESSCDNPNNYLAVGSSWNNKAGESNNFIGRSAPYVGFRLVEDI